MALKGNHIGSVYIKVRPDAKNFRRETQRQVGREPIEVEVEVRPEDERRLVNDVDRMSRRAEDKARIKFEPNYDSIRDAKRNVERMLRDLGSHEIDLDLNTDSLKDARADLEEMLGEGVETTVRYTEDEEGYQDILDRIEDIRRQKAEVEITFETDDDSLDALEADISRKLDALATNRDPAELIFGDKSSVQRVIDEITRELDRLDEMETSIDVDSTEVEQARRQLEELRKAAEKVQGSSSETSMIRPMTDPFFYRVTEAQLDTLSRDRWVNIKTRMVGRLSSAALGTFLSLAGLNEIRTMVEQIEHVVTHFDEVAIQAGQIGAAIGTAASVGTVALGGLLTTLRDIGQAFQLAAMGPTLLLSAYSGFATWRAITKDFTAALMGIPGVLEKMPPNAQRGVKAIQALQAATEDAVQNNFWGQMTDQVERFTKRIGPTVTQAMGQVSANFGRAIVEMIDHLDELVQDGTLERFARDNAVLYHHLADAAQPFFRGLMNMAQSGSKYLPRMGEWIKRMAHDFESFMGQAINSGKFDLWVRNGVRAFQNLGRVASSTFGILGDFTRIFDRLNIGGLEAMADGMERINRFTASAGFQRKMENIFTGAKAGAASAAQGFGDLIKVLYDLDDLTADLLRTSGELAGNFMSGIAEAMNEPRLHNGMRRLFEGLNDFVRRAQPGFEALSQIIGDLGVVGGEVARQIAPGLNLTTGLISGVMDRMRASMTSAVEPLTRIFENLTAMSSGPLLMISSLAATVLDIFVAWPGPVQSVVLALMAASRFMGPITAGLASMRGAMTKAFAGDMIGPRLDLRGQMVLPFRQAMDESRRIVQDGGSRIAGAWRGSMLVMQRATTTAARGMKGAFSGLMGAMGGGWGMAIVGGIALLGQWAGAQAEAKMETEALTRAIQAQDEAATRQAIFDGMKEEMQGFVEQGGDLERVLRDLQDGDYVTVANDLALAYKAIGANASEMDAGQLEMIGLTADEMERGLQIAKRYNIEHENTGDAANTLSAAIMGQRGRFEEANIQAKLNAEVMKAVGAEVEGAADEAEQASPRFQLMADALERLHDESSAAEERVRALNEAIALGNEQEVSSKDFAREQTKAMDSAFKDLDRLIADRKENKFKFGDLFDTEGLNLDGSMAAVQLEGVWNQMRDSHQLNMLKIRDQWKNGELDGKEYEEAITSAYQGMKDAGAEMADHWGLQGAQRDEFIKQWESWIPSEKELRAKFEAFTDISGDIEKLKQMGISLSEHEYEMIFDADGDNVITEVERANRLGIMFDSMIWSAKLDGDEQGMHDAYLTALSMGFMHDGKTWVASLDADGEPTAEMIAWANKQGYEYSNGVWEAKLDADPAGAKDGAKKATDAVKGVPDKKAKIDADPSGATKGAGTAKTAISTVKDHSVTVTATPVGLSGLMLLRSAIAAIQSKTVTITAKAKNALGGIGSALGGFLRGGGAADGAMTGTRFRKSPFQVQAFADGGINYTSKPTSAYIAKAGSYTMFAERETGGEAYIPLSAAKRERSLAIWSEVGKRFGVMADGGITTSAATSSGPVFNIHNQYPQAEPTSVSINKALAQAGHPLGGDY